MSWFASTDNVAVTSYGVYLDGASVGTTSATSFTIVSLACGTTHTVAVDAADQAGNRSARASVNVATSSCPDLTAPSKPSGLGVSAITTTGLTLSWSASTDNVGVTGYDVSVNGSLLEQTSSLAFPVSGLACGTTYSFAVDARDAAGNVSAASSVSAATSACPPPPSAPAVAPAPPSPTPPGNGAQVYVSPTGNDSTCLRGDVTRPCATFQQAYSIANLGDTVQVAAGAYPRQTLTDTGKSRSSSQQVTFQPAPGATVTVQGLQFGSSLGSADGPTNITVSGITAAASSTNPCDLELLTGTNNVTVTGFSGCSFYINGPTNVAVTNSNFGPCVQVPNGNCGPNDIDSTPLGNNVTLDHDTIHDYSTTTQYESALHQQCLTIAGETNVTVSNTTFSGCQVFDIFLQYGSSVAAGNFDGLKLLNNVFAAPLQDTGAIRNTAIQFSPRGYTFNNITVSGNTFGAGSGLTFDSTTPTPTNFTVSGNTMGIAANCVTGLSYSNNIWPSGTC